MAFVSWEEVRQPTMRRTNSGSGLEAVDPGSFGNMLVRGYDMQTKSWSWGAGAGSHSYFGPDGVQVDLASGLILFDPHATDAPSGKCAGVPLPTLASAFGLALCILRVNVEPLSSFNWMYGKGNETLPRPPDLVASNDLSMVAALGGSAALQVQNSTIWPHLNIEDLPPPQDPPPSSSNASGGSCGGCGVSSCSSCSSCGGCGGCGG